MKSTGALIFFLLSLVSPALAKHSDFPVSGSAVFRYQLFDAKFIALMKHWQMPGAAVAILKNNRIVYARGFGYANVEKKIPAEPDSVFRIASISKTITATAVLSLVKAHQLDLNAPVFDYLGLTPLPNETLNPQVKAITISELLYMTSGFSKRLYPLFGPIPKSVAAKVDHLPMDCQTAARLMMSQALSDRPGTTFAYSNISYCILGLVVEKASGLPYGTYVQKALLDPLNIHDMNVAHTKPGENYPKEVTYYPFHTPIELTDPGLVVIDGLAYGDNDLLQKNFADGGWVASAESLVTFINAIATHRLLGNELVYLMTHPPARVMKVTHKRKNSGKMLIPNWPYGMGFWLSSQHGLPFLYTHGSFTGTNSIVFWRPDGTLVAIIFNGKPTSFVELQRLRNSLKMLVSHFV